jgi:mannose-6-phosphate isomerase-like protein (cupin superfamily)
MPEIARGAVSYKQVGHSMRGRNVQILRECYAPGADTGRVSLSHGGQEGGVVISGRIELTVDGVRSVLGAGDAYYFDSTKPHRFRNTGRESCVIVSACSPPTV